MLRNFKIITFMCFSALGALQAASAWDNNVTLSRSPKGDLRSEAGVVRVRSFDADSGVTAGLLADIRSCYQGVDLGSMQQCNQAVDQIGAVMSKAFGPVLVVHADVAQKLDAQRDAVEQEFKKICVDQKVQRSFWDKLWSSRSAPKELSLKPLELEVSDYVPTAVHDIDGVEPYLQVSCDKASQEGFTFVKNTFLPAIVQWGICAKNKVKKELSIAVQAKLTEEEFVLKQKQDALSAKQKELYVPLLNGCAQRTGVAGVLAMIGYGLPRSQFVKKAFYVGSGACFLKTMWKFRNKMRAAQAAMSDLYVDTEMSKWYVSALKNVKYTDDGYCKKLVQLCENFLKRCQEIQDGKKEKPKIAQRGLKPEVYQPVLPTKDKGFFGALASLLGC